MKAEKFDWTELKASLPSLLESVPGKSQKTKAEWSAPCPWCGGDDRFLIWPAEDEGCGRFSCRMCGATGDRIDFHCRLEGLTKGQLFEKYSSPDTGRGRHASKTRPTMGSRPAAKAPIEPPKKLSPAEVDQLWQQIQADCSKKKTVNDKILHYHLHTKRNIHPSVIRTSEEAGNVSIKWFDLDSVNLCNEHQSSRIPTTAVLYKDAEGQPSAIQLIGTNKKGLLVPGEDKIFIQGSEARNSFFICGRPLSEADTIVLVEAAINALTVVSVIPDVCCVSLGNASGKKIKKLSDQLTGKKIVCFFDNDDAGRKAAVDVATALQRNDICSIQWNHDDSKGLDVNDLLRAGQGQRIIEMLDRAKPVTVKDDIQERVLELNKSFAAVLNNGQFCILQEVIEPVFGRPDIHLLKPGSFYNWFANDKIKVSKGENTEKVSIAKLWIESPYRRQYKGIVFSPGQEDKPGYYNLFRGLAIEPRQGKWDLVRTHIHEIICNSDDNLFQWVLCWLARIVQDPGGERPGTALILRGIPGCGKGTLLSAFGPLFGSHYLHISQKKHLLGKFNNLIKDALVVFLDEITWDGNQDEAGAFKTLITEPIYTIEPKGINPFTIKNHVNVITSSNSDWCVPAGMEDRRFCVLDVSPKQKGNRAYFDQLHHQIEHGGREAMLYDLLKVDTSQVDLRTIPRTDGLVDQIIHSLNSVEAFWFDRLFKVMICRDRLHKWESDEYFPASVLHDAYVKYCSDYRQKETKALREFLRVVKRLCPGIQQLRKLLDLSKYYKEEKADLSAASKKVQSILLPSLEECRTNFEDIIGRKIEWPKEEG